MQFLTFRRHYLDAFFSSISYSGKVLDIGGERSGRRGQFVAPSGPDVDWTYLNLDVGTQPDLVSDAHHLAFGDNTFDMILLAEVLEHLEHPEIVLREISRVLKPGGTFLATMPLLYPIHPDPRDFQRWTPERIEIEFERSGLVVSEVKTMGGTFAVLHDVFRYSLVRSPYKARIRNRLVWKFMVPVIRWIFLKIDEKVLKNSYTTTGFFVVSTKE